MANDENLKGHGFHERSANEVRALARKGGQKSGETRRRKAEFKKVLNAMLTAKIENPEWGPTLEAMGLECTLETVINARMIFEAMNGNVKAYEAIAKYSGQDLRTPEEIEKEKIDIELAKKELNPEENDGGDEIKIVIDAEECE